MKRFLFLAALGATAYLTYRVLRPRYSFRGRHVLITGGSRGLGLVLARRFAAEGARLTICSRDANELLRAEDNLTERGVKPLTVQCDVTDRDRVREMVAVARDRNGPIDVLVNNAGVIQVGPVEEMREADYGQSLRTHFWGPLHTCLEVIPHMKARGEGRIVNISSIGGKIAVPHLLPYSAGKFALVGFSTGLRAELAQHNIAVTTVSPGLMRTGSHLNAEFKGRHADEYAWFAFGNSIPGLSVSAESAARSIVEACAVGDAELVIGLPAKMAVAAHALAPNLTAELLACVNQKVLPEPGGIGADAALGRQSRGKLPSFVTTLTDRAAARNNEVAVPRVAEGEAPVPLAARAADTDAVVPLVEDVR
jgi:NAD(P)-dependent dehydrogenase (short-subunit alcohol dehydrogenase family)